MNEKQRHTTVKSNEHSCWFTPVYLPSINYTSYCVLLLKQQQQPFCYSSGCCQKLPLLERLFPPLSILKRLQSDLIIPHAQMVRKVWHFFVAFWGKQLQTIRKKKKKISLSTNVTSGIFNPWETLAFLPWKVIKCSVTCGFMGNLICQVMVLRGSPQGVQRVLTTACRAPTQFVTLMLKEFSRTFHA